jgi:hypothetical protein
MAIFTPDRQTYRHLVASVERGSGPGFRDAGAISRHGRTEDSGLKLTLLAAVEAQC